MRVVGGTVGLAASSTSVQRRHDSVSEQRWGQPGANNVAGAAQVRPARSVAPAARQAPIAPLVAAPTPLAPDATDATDPTGTGDPFIDNTVSLLELMFGVKVTFVRMRFDGRSTEAAQKAAAAAAAASSNGARPTGVGGEIRIEHVAERDQRLEVSAHVRLELSDGNVLEADLGALLEHSERVSSTTTIGWGDKRPVDPLFLALDGGVPVLGDRTWRFDLDSDGRVESLAAPAGGSVVVGIDRNGDGAITTGAEILGATSGDAYGELAALDSDGSGWIDEGDEAWSSLRVVDGDAGSRTLAEAGVGALSTTAVKAAFTHGDLGDPTGETREVGVFVRENGTLGVAARLDLLA